MKIDIRNLPQPRDYQEKGLLDIRQALKDGFKNPLLFLATGGGKSVIFIHLVIRALNNGFPVVLVMRRKQLVMQAYRHFEKYGVLGSVVMANDKRFDPLKKFQICSIDTVGRRDLDFMRNLGDKTICIVDEAHDAVSSTYQEFFKQVSFLYRVGLTASPFRIGRRAHDSWDCVVKPIEVHELRDRGYLTDARIYTPNRFHGQNIKKTAGDYNQKALSEHMSEMAIVGNIVENYQKLGEGKPAICFCVDKNHSKLVAESFNKAGIKAVHCDESTKQKQRDLALEQLERGEIQVLCNVNIFSTGVDVAIEVGILARPTESEVLYIQQIGRFLRPMSKCGKCGKRFNWVGKCPVCGSEKPEYIKEMAIIIDHGENVVRHGSPFQIRQAYMDSNSKKKDSFSSPSTMKTCQACFANYEKTHLNCPYCKHVNEKPERTYLTKSGELVPYDEILEIRNRFSFLQYQQKSRGFKPNYPYFKLYENYGARIFEIKEIKIPPNVISSIRIMAAKNKIGKKKIYN